LDYVHQLDPAGGSLD